MTDTTIEIVSNHEIPDKLQIPAQIQIKPTDDEFKYEKLSEVQLNVEHLSEIKKINKTDIDFSVVCRNDYIDITVQTKDNIIYQGYIIFKETMRDLLNDIADNKHKDFDMEADGQYFYIKVTYTTHIYNVTDTIILPKTDKIKPKEFCGEINLEEKNSILYLTIISNFHTYKTNMEYSVIMKNLFAEIQSKKFTNYSVKFGNDACLLTINYFSYRSLISQDIVFQKAPCKLNIISLQRKKSNINMIVLLDCAKRYLYTPNNELIWCTLQNIQNGSHDDYRWELNNNEYSLSIGYIDTITDKRQILCIKTSQRDMCIIL